MKYPSTLPALAIILVAIASNASQVKGTISIKGGWHPNSEIQYSETLLGNASGGITEATDDFSGAITASPGALLGKDWIFTGFSPTPFEPPPLFWQVMTGPGNTPASFFLTKLTDILQEEGDPLQLAGLGVLKLQGFEDVPSTWSFVWNEQEGSSFTLTAVQTPIVPTVPEGGTTATLLYAALTALTVLRRQVGSRPL